MNYRVIGYIEDNLDEIGRENDERLPEMPIVGHKETLSELALKQRVHEVIVATEQQLNNELFQQLLDCQANGVIVSWMPDLYEKIYRRIPIQHVDPTWVLQAMQGQPVFSRLQLALKRLLDIVIVITALPTVILLVPMIALAIRLDSYGPIFFRQTRCGRAGKTFTMYKFRTMRVDAEEDGEPRWADENDDRITKVGRWLRRTRLDELPQVFNILHGEMSLVGPRPERPEFVAQLVSQLPYYRTRHMVKPGLTGWAQVHYDYGNSIQDALVKLQYDFYYVRYWSILLDIYTIFRTIGVVFQLRGT